MAGMEFGLGRFGDRRLQKGGFACMQRWLHGQARAFGGLAEAVRERCSSDAFCTTVR